MSSDDYMLLILEVRVKINENEIYWDQQFLGVNLNLFKLIVNEHQTIFYLI